VAAYHVAWKCVVEQWLGVRRTTHVHSLVEKLKRFYENARCYNKIYSGGSLLEISLYFVRVTFRV